MTDQEINHQLMLKQGWVYYAGAGLENPPPGYRRDGKYIPKTVEYCWSIERAMDLVKEWPGKLFSLSRKPEGWCASFGDGENLHIGLVSQAMGETAEKAIALSYLAIP